MIRIILFTTMLLASIIANGQVSENRTVTNFSKIKVAQGIELYFTQSESYSLKVETDDLEKMQYVKTVVEGTTLNVYIETQKSVVKKVKKWSNNLNFKVLKVYVSAPMVAEFKASSSGSISLQNELKVDKLNVAVSSSGDFSGTIKCKEAEFEVSSSGDIRVQLFADTVNVAASSSADVVLSGSANVLSVKASSSADCDARDLKVKTAAAVASSSSKVLVNVSESLNAKASSSADVYYYGTPKNVVADKSSSGSVTPR